MERVDHPARFSLVSQSHAWRHVFEYLTYTDPKGITQPYLLEKWEASDDLLTWTLYVRKGYWRNGEDGYGEHEDGSPFNGTGVGRAWPLLTGERAHYELAANHQDEAIRLLHTIKSFANGVGLLPEQVWDTSDIPERELYFGKPFGSTMPLVWAHAEYVKLRRSLRDRHVFDMPPQTVQRYVVEQTGSPYAIWRFNHKCQTISVGQTLRVEVLAPALIHWSSDGWQTTRDTRTRETGLGIHVADLPTSEIPGGTTLTFTLHWPAED